MRNEKSSRVGEREIEGTRRDRDWQLQRKQSATNLSGVLKLKYSARLCDSFVYCVVIYFILVYKYIVLYMIYICISKLQLVPISCTTFKNLSP